MRTSLALAAAVAAASCADSSITTPSARGPVPSAARLDVAPTSTGASTAPSTLVHSGSGRCLNVAGVNTAPGGAVIIWQCSGGQSNELWAVSQSGVAAELRVYGALCLADESGGGAKGSRLVTANCSGAAPQRWTLTPAGQLQNAASQACVVGADGFGNGTRPVLGECTTGQQWTAPNGPAASAGRATSLVVGVASSRCVNLAGERRTPGGSMILWDCIASAQNEQVELSPAGAAGPLKIYGLCLQPTGTADGTAITTATCTGAALQDWTLQTSGQIQQATTGMCLTPAGAGSGNGNPLVIAVCFGRPDQRWTAPSLGAAAPVTPVAPPPAASPAPTAATFTGLLRSVRSGYCFNAAGGIWVPVGSSIVLWDCAESADNEQVSFDGVDVAGPVRVLGRCIADRSGAGQTGSALVTATCTGAPAQRWTLTRTGELKNAVSGACAAPTGDAKGAALALAACTGGAEQRWHAPRAPVLVPTLALGAMPRGASGVFGLVGTAPSVASVQARGGLWAQYEENFVWYANRFWDYEGASYGADFYDRAQIYYAQWARSGNPTYLDRANQLAVNARSYMREQRYYPQPFMMMLDGVALHAVATGDSVSARTVALTADALAAPGSYWSNNLGDPANPDVDGRTQARVLNALLDAWYLKVQSPSGWDYAARLRELMPKILATQASDGAYRFVAQCYSNKSFMTGMVNDALIRYHNAFEADPRIVPAVKKAVDYLWAQSWNAQTVGFQYLDRVCNTAGSGGDTTPTADLNGMIVNGFGFVAKQTGDQSYLVKGDQVFAGGVYKAWLFGSKQFNQTFTTSYAYLGTRF